MKLGFRLVDAVAWARRCARKTRTIYWVWDYGLCAGYNVAYACDKGAGRFPVLAVCPSGNVIRFPHRVA